MSIFLSLNSVTTPTPLINLRPPPQLPLLSAARLAGSPFAAKIPLLRSCSASSGDASFSGEARTLARLKSYGISGILSYGLLNTAYYLTTFLVVWFYVAPSPTKMGYMAAVQRFLKVMTMVWAGSQVTKIMRAGGALALAPFVLRGLSWFTIKFRFGTQGKAVTAISGICFGLAFLMFVIVTLLWA